jgi:hypothetical protein
MSSWTRVTIAAVMFAAGLVAGWLAYFLLAMPPATAVAQIDRRPVTSPQPQPPAPALPGVTASPRHCQLSWMPSGYVQSVPPARTAELAHTLDDWIHAGTPASEPAIEPTSGLIFAGPESKRVCGLPSSWARYALRDGLLRSELACCDNVCSFGGGSEGSPSEWLVFRPLTPDAAGRHWALDAWIEITATGLPPAIVAANYQAVTDALTRLRDGGCPAEPAAAH